MTAATIEFGLGRLAIEDIATLAAKGARARMTRNAAKRERIAAGARLLDEMLARDGVIYGVTTGYGDSCTVSVPAALVAELPHHLYTYHGCGLGREFDDAETRAILACRLASLAQGWSGVSPELLAQIEAFLEHDILPCIPAEGSVGASGDLTPLSYLAAALCGEREVRWAGERMPAAKALDEIGLAPLRLRPKEGLALMNGTAVMTALACLAYVRAERLAVLASRVTALAVAASGGNPHHFDETLFSVKPHPGQQRTAARIRADLVVSEGEGYRLQDRYSLRCAPHVIGVLEDALPFFRTLIENELNSANDNPIVDVEGERVLHGGHFYGGHIGFAMDGLKTAVASVADLLDRQFALINDARYNHGLPANLSGATGERAAISHGLKALQIGASAWTAEALKLTMPATSFSRSTECHNQDKVSMGTIAARDALRVLTLAEQVLAAMLVAVRQGVSLRERIEPACLSETGRSFHSQLAAHIPFIEEDVALDGLLRNLVRQMNEGAFDDDALA